MIALTENEFEQLKKILNEKLGLYLGDNMKEVVEGQLQSILTRHNFPSFQALCEHLQKAADNKLLLGIQNVITPGHTFFFREKDHFDFLSSTVFPELYSSEKGLRDIRIWCAACSSGEESYGIGMHLMEYFQNRVGVDLGVLATDISMSSLSKAKKGVYSDAEVSKVPLGFKQQFFQQAKPGLWQVTPDLQKLITFRQFNILSKSFPFQQPFDAIFCRNLLIYFDNESIEKVVRNIYDFTSPGGYLFIGSSESLQTLDSDFEYIAPGIYRRGK